MTDQWPCVSRFWIRLPLSGGGYVGVGVVGEAEDSATYRLPALSTARAVGCRTSPGALPAVAITDQLPCASRSRIWSLPVSATYRLPSPSTAMAAGKWCEP